jgi:hypothetical protein
MDTVEEAQTMNGKKAVSARQDGRKEDGDGRPLHHETPLGHATVDCKAKKRVKTNVRTNVAV